MRPSFEVLAERFPCDGERVAIDEVVLEQVSEDLCSMFFSTHQMSKFTQHERRTTYSVYHQS